MKTDNIFDLQFFADGAAAPTAVTTGSGEGAAAAASTATETAAPNNNAETETEVKYGIQPDEDVTDTSGAENTQTEDGGKVDTAPPEKMYTREELKKATERAVKQRFKAIEKEKELLAPMYRYLSEELDCDINDLKTMAEKAEAARKARYQKIGAETGNDPSEVERTADDRYDAHNYREQLRVIREQGEADRFNKRIDAELKTAQETYPQMDYFEEIKNPTFRTMINNGFSVLNAYETVHREEVRAQIREAAIKETTEKMSRSIASGTARPTEGGVSGSSATKFVTDPTNLTKEQRADVKRRARRGERIIW